MLAPMTGGSQGLATPSPAVPVEPVGAIVEALRTHDVVALGEGDHGNEQGHAVRLSLVRDPRFAAAANDIVVEAGNALYQATMDQFVDGQDVPDASLRRIWQNTTQPFTTFDIPIYEEFFRAVREVNRSQPRERHIRVLLGDPPIDWDAVHSREEHGKWLAVRDQYPADLIRREVIARHRRALIVYGGMHLQRKNLSFNYEDGEDLRTRTIVNLLEQSAPAVKVFSIWTNTETDLQSLQSDVREWRRPSLARTRGTALGAADFTVFSPLQADRFSILKDGRFVTVPRAGWRTLRMEDQFDAVLYLGARFEITHANLPFSLCADPAYMKMRMERFALVGLPPDAAERLKRYCAGAAPKN
jgi:hypothetical protein